MIDAKAIRQRAGLTTRALAKMMRISDERTIRRWQSGETPVTGPASIILEMLDAGELPARYLTAASTALAQSGDKG